MRKISLYRLFYPIVLVVLLGLTQSCGSGYVGRTSLVTHESEAEQFLRNQERLRATYGKYLQYSAQVFAEKASKLFSPRSGREQVGKALLYDSKLVENYDQGYVSCKAVLRWQARDIGRLVPYGWCELRGTIYLFPDHNGKMMAEFSYEESNQHVIDVSSPHHWDKISNGLIITL